MRRCTATTETGRPCQAWPVRHSDPPLCKAHGGEPLERTPAPESRSCTAARLDGRPCRAWAIPGSRPPRCSAHRDVDGGGDAAGEPSWPTHPLYGRHFSDEEMADLASLAVEVGLADEIATGRVIIGRLLGMLDRRDLTQRETLELIKLLLRALRDVASLLRDQQAMSDGAADGLQEAVAKALDELAAEWEL